MEGELRQLSQVIQQALRAPKTKGTSHFIELTDKIDVLLANFSQSDFIILSLTPAVKECIQLLIDLLHSSTSPSCSRIPSNLFFRIFSLFTNLIISSPCMIHLLNHCRILSLLTSLLPTLKEPNVTQLLKLVNGLIEERLSVIHVREVEGILKLCINTVLSSSSNNDQLSVSLNVLVNLYRDNVPAQTWAISNPQHDAFQKKLVSLLPNKSVAVIIASLHLLAILSLKEKLGEKIFKAGNLQQTMQLIMSIICTSNDDSALRNAIDLIKLLLNNCDHFDQTLTRSPQLSSNLNKSFKRITEINAKNSFKLLELFCVLSDIPTIALIIGDILFIKNTSSISSGIQGILQILAEKDAIYSAAVMEAMKLVATLIKNNNIIQLLTNTTLTSLLSAVDVVLNDHLLHSEGDEFNRITLRKMETALSLLHTVVKIPSFSHVLLQDKSLDSTHLIDVVRDQFKHNVILNSTAEQSKWSVVGISVAVSILHLLIILSESYSKCSKEDIRKLIQDPKVLLLIAHGIQNGDQYTIQHSLHVLNYVFTIDDNSIQSFSEVLINEQNHTSYSTIGMCTATPTSQLSGSEFSGRMRDITNVSEVKGVDNTSIEQLIEKFRSGLEIRDIRASEIMSLYEHKLKGMTSKENHLQDLLEAKALALSQADRLLSQYRGKMTMSDVEFEKMRCIIQGTEKECERLHDEEIMYQQRNQELNTMVDCLQTEKIQLLKVAEQHQTLTRSYHEQSMKLEMAERNVSDLQTLKSEFEQQIGKLRNDNQTLQQTVTSKMENIEELIQRLTHSQTTLQISEAKCEELNHLIQSRESQITMLENVQKNSEAQINKLQHDNCTLQQTVISKQECIDESTAKCEELNVIVGDRELQIATLENIRETLEQNVSELSKAFTDSEDKNNRLLQQLETLQREINDLQKNVCQLNSEVKRLKEENCSLTQEVNLFSAVRDLISKGTKS